MIGWLMTWATQIGAVVLGVWFLNGLRKALFRPRLRLVGYTKTAAGTFVETERQQLLPPWLTLRETWMRQGGDFIRESDGVALSSDRFGPVFLNHQLERMLDVRVARDKETEELSK